VNERYSGDAMNERPTGRQPPIRILVVEDDEISRICLAALLAQMGFDVEQAETGGQAVDLIQAQSFDLVLMDLHLPDGSGEEILQAFQALDTPLPPVFAVTTRVTPERSAELLKAGFADYLLKPVSAETLESKVTRLRGQAGLLELSRQIADHLQYALPLGVTLVKKLLAELPEQLGAIESDIVAGHLEKATAIVHKMNGAAGFIGLGELQRKANSMEEALLCQNEAVLQSAWDSLKKEAQRLLALGPELLDLLSQDANLNLSNKA